MAEKKNESAFTVTDRRLFTSDGELRPEASKETEEARQATPIKEATIQEPTIQESTIKETAPAAKSPAPAQEPVAAAGTPDREMPIPPTKAEQDAQAAAYKQSSKDLDSEVELSGHSAREFDITFERFLASLYMTAMLQLGLMRQQGEQPHVDIIGARQTIDTLSLIGEKTKGNLTTAEENFLQNSLYELRMAYVEVTNALTRPPQAGPATGTSGR
jgi:hypothetical protein